MGTLPAPFFPRHNEHMKLLPTGWVDAQSLTVEGRGWDQPGAPWIRLPERLRGKVRPELWERSTHAAGIAVRLVCSGAQLDIRWELGSNRLSMPHLPSTAHSGIDVYVRTPDRGWRFVHNGRPGGVSNQTNVRFANTAARECMVYLPLHNPVRTLAVASPGGVVKAPERMGKRAKPVVIYGTSIVQGTAASRPGMAWTSILGRKMDWPVVNLGFAGQGRLDPEIGECLAEIDSAAVVVDCLWNSGSLGGRELGQRVQTIARAIRQARPNVPIVFVGRIHFDASRARNPSDTQQRNAVAELKRSGVGGVHLVEAETMLGDDHDATVDGTHPSDLGMLRLAEAMERSLRPLVD